MQDEPSRDLLKSLPKSNVVRERLKTNQQERAVLRRLLKLAVEAESHCPSEKEAHL